MSLLLLGVFFESDRPGNYQVDRLKSLRCMGQMGAVDPSEILSKTFGIFSLANYLCVGTG